MFLEKISWGLREDGQINFALPLFFIPWLYPNEYSYGVIAMTLKLYLYDRCTGYTYAHG